MKVIIVGAGMAGLMAARELSKKNVEVLIVEALERVGGRTQTLHPQAWDFEIEAGAEFIHGDLPLTLGLLKEAGIGLEPANLNMYRVAGKQIRKGFGQGAEWERFFNVVNALTQDVTVAEVLEQNFSAKRYERLRAEISEMAEGLDLADIERLSVFGIRDEWQSTEPQFRPVGGYGKLVSFLVDELQQQGVTIKCDTPVDRIEWSPGSVSVHARHFREKADAVILTVPLGALRAGQISFSPDIPKVRNALEQLGFGSVVKMALYFKYPFWLDRKPDMGFLFTPSGYTFWTQPQRDKPLLTAWMSHKLAEKTKHLTDEELISHAQAELSEVFSANTTGLGLLDAKAFRYTSDTFFKGAYSWPTVRGMALMSGLLNGVDKTLWFAGEAFAPNGEVGTVEAALWSGKNCAAAIEESNRKNA